MAGARRRGGGAGRAGLRRQRAGAAHRCRRRRRSAAARCQRGGGGVRGHRHRCADLGVREEAALGSGGDRGSRRRHRGGVDAVRVVGRGGRHRLDRADRSRAGPRLPLSRPLRQRPVDRLAAAAHGAGPRRRRRRHLPVRGRHRHRPAVRLADPGDHGRQRGRLLSVAGRLAVCRQRPGGDDAARVPRAPPAGPHRRPRPRADGGAAGLRHLRRPRRAQRLGRLLPRRRARPHRRRTRGVGRLVPAAPRSRRSALPPGCSGDGTWTSSSSTPDCTARPTAIRTGPTRPCSARCRSSG